jgi:hypothetical protein
MARQRPRGRAGKLLPVNALLGYAMPPEYELRVKLGQVAKEWTRVIGPFLGQQSAPVDISDGELLVVAETPLVASRLSMMGGNIARAVKRWKLDVVKVKVVVGRLPLKSTRPREDPPHVFLAGAKEEHSKELARSYLEKSPDLPEDIVESLARLQAFFIKRFGEK